MSQIENWNARYRDAETPWDTGYPSMELQRVIADEGIAPCRALELGCGTGTNSVWLAQKGFDVVGVDLSPLAIEKASQRAEKANVKVRFLAADVMDLPDLGGPFRFFFDRGCYHVVRRDGNAETYIDTLASVTSQDAQGLILAGNAKEPHDPGPPTVSEEELRSEWQTRFTIQWLREFRFDSTPNIDESFLAWSAFVRKK